MVAVPCEGKITDYVWMVEGVAEDRPGGCCAPTAASPGTEASRNPLGSPGCELVLQQQKMLLKTSGLVFLGS